MKLTRKFWKRTLLLTGSVFLLLVATLFVHIYMVTRPNDKDDFRTRQLARIQFTEALDAETLGSVKANMYAMNGVRTVKYFEAQKAIVYELDPKVQSTDKVFSEVIEKNDLPAKKFVIDKSRSADGCPVLDKSSLSYRLGTFFQNLL